MDEQKPKIPPEVEQLLVELARTYNWISMYQENHPSLAKRIETMHRALTDRINREPSGHLFFGIAKDKVLYRDVFLGCGQHLVHRFTECLFLQQVATVDFSAEISPKDLLAFLRGMHRSSLEKTGEPLESLLKKEGVRGIGLYPYNYKDVLSRKILSPNVDEASGDREDELWRMLLTENIADTGKDGGKIVEEITGAPEMIPSILRRAYAASEAGLNFATSPHPGTETVSPELVQKLLGRLGGTIGKLPDDQKSRILRFLDTGFEEMCGGKESTASLEYLFGQSLTGSQPDNEFLDLLAAFLSVEHKGGKRLRKIFEIIASERNSDNALLTRTREHIRESLRTKNYFAQKTWGTVEGFLLTRSEEAYIGKDHVDLLESLSCPEEGLLAASKPVSPVNPAYAEDFDEKALHRKSTDVLLELLEIEGPEEEFLGTLEDIRKIIPNLISRKEFALLKVILSTLASIENELPDGRKPPIRNVIAKVDFAHVIDLYLSPDLSAEDRKYVQEIIVSFPEAAARDVFDRLLMEPEKSNRRALLTVAFRFGPAAIPAIVERMESPQWYFVRNLCLILSEIGSPRAVPNLIRALDHPDHRVKREAVAALGKIKAPEAVPYLGKILLTESILPSPREDSLRIDAGNALFRCGGARGASYLHRALECRHTAVKNHCKSLLRSLPK